MRWFGVIRTNNGKVKYSSCDKTKCPDHMDFLKDHCGFTEEDTVLELFDNATLTHDDFLSYAKEVYIRGRAPAQSM